MVYAGFCAYACYMNNGIKGRGHENFYGAEINGFLYLNRTDGKSFKIIIKVFPCRTF
jgi:hypothetical protein